MNELSDALEVARDSAAEWKEAHASQKALLSGQLNQLHIECKAKHQAYVALQLRFDELEASVGHKATVEQSDAAREVEQLRLKLETIASDKAKLQNALTVSMEDFQRLNLQLCELRRALKESDGRAKAHECQLELVGREKASLEEVLSRKELVEQDLGQSLKRQLLLNEEMEESFSRTSAVLAAALGTLKSELDSFACTFNLSKEELEAKVEDLENGVRQQEEHIRYLTERVEEGEARLQEREHSLQEHLRSRVKELEEGHARKIDKLYQISLREQTEGKAVFEKQQAVLTDRIKFLEMSVSELQKRAEAEKADREELIKDYDNALDEMERNHARVGFGVLLCRQLVLIAHG